MSFPEKLTLSHLIDIENEKDSTVAKEHRADSVQHRNISSSSASAAVDGDAGEFVVFACTFYYEAGCVAYWVWYFHF